MPSRNTVIRSLHDLGAAAWFGGSLMGAVGLNGAADAVRDPQDRARVASLGWAKWAPVNAAAIGAHLVGGGGTAVCEQGPSATPGRGQSEHDHQDRCHGRCPCGDRIQRCPRSQDRHSRRRIRRGCYRTGALDPRRGHRRSAATAVCAVGSAGSDRGHRRSGRRSRASSNAPHKFSPGSVPLWPVVSASEPALFPEQTRLMMQNSDSSTITVEDAPTAARRAGNRS